MVSIPQTRSRPFPFASFPVNCILLSSFYYPTLTPRTLHRGTALLLVSLVLDSILARQPAVLNFVVYFLITRHISWIVEPDVAITALFHILSHFFFVFVFVFYAFNFALYNRRILNVVKKARNGCVNKAIEIDLCSFIGYDKTSLPTEQRPETQCSVFVGRGNW
jgi:hypothetical protein